MQRAPDDLVGHMGTVEVAGVDVVDARRDGFPEQRDRAFHVARRAEDTRAGELHGAVAEAIDSQRRPVERE